MFGSGPDERNRWRNDMKVGRRTWLCVGSAMALVFALAGRARADQTGPGNAGVGSDSTTTSEPGTPNAPAVDHVRSLTEPPPFDPESDTAKRARAEARKHPAPVPQAPPVRTSGLPARESSRGAADNG